MHEMDVQGTGCIVHRFSPTYISPPKHVLIAPAILLPPPLLYTQDMSNEIQEALGTSYATPEMDDDELMDELDALEGELLDEALGEEGPSYLAVRVGVCVWWWWWLFPWFQGRKE